VACGGPAGAAQAATEADFGFAAAPAGALWA